ncbi:hypothetical protein P4O66_021425 [Electrophorus voltai]|uniref:Sulfotransferase n=1 Tax=Electrophorus voltai TaxID=2609070 RepID=A0AAD8ZP26_9TELE|nr:hypothetical protein P4O66_021425 [Electrophorus voltai]
MGCWSTRFNFGHLKAQSKVSVFFTMIILFTYVFYCLTGYCDLIPSPLHELQSFKNKRYPEEGSKPQPVAPWNRSIVRDLPGSNQDFLSQNVEETNHIYSDSYNLSVFNNFGNKEFPQAIIIGVKKGGTRALLEFLRVHPDVRAVGAEPHFFDRFYEKGLEWYRFQNVFKQKASPLPGMDAHGALLAEPAHATHVHHTHSEGSMVTVTMAEAKVRSPGHRNLGGRFSELTCLEQSPCQRPVCCDGSRHRNLSDTQVRKITCKPTANGHDNGSYGACCTSQGLQNLPFACIMTSLCSLEFTSSAECTQPDSMFTQAVFEGFRLVSKEIMKESISNWEGSCSEGMSWNIMPRTLEGQITMEKTPSYFVTREAPRRVYAMSRHTKLIVVVRDPVTRAISDYTQTLSKSPSLPSFQDLVFRNSSTGLIDTAWSAVRIGIYAKHLENWLRFFPLSRLLFVSGERLVTDPAGEMGHVQDFLGLKRVVTNKHFYFNQTKGFPCLKKPEGGSRPRCLGKSKGRAHPHIPAEVLLRLRDFYRPFNLKFYQMTGQDFGWE